MSSTTSVICIEELLGSYAILEEVLSCFMVAETPHKSFPHIPPHDVLKSNLPLAKSTNGV